MITMPPVLAQLPGEHAIGFEAERHFRRRLHMLGEGGDLGEFRATLTALAGATPDPGGLSGFDGVVAAIGAHRAPGTKERQATAESNLSR